MSSWGDADAKVFRFEGEGTGEDTLIVFRLKGLVGKETE